MKRLFAGLAGFAVAVAANAQDPSQIPIADFFKLPDVETARLSPNGEYIATSRFVNNTKNAVGVTELATNKITATLAFTQGESIAEYSWVSPTRLLLVMAEGFGRLDQPLLTGELQSVDADGKNLKYLYGYRGKDTTGTRIQVGAAQELGWAEFVGPLDGDPEHALIQVRRLADKAYSDIKPTLQRIHVVTGQRKIIDDTGLLEPSAIADDAGKSLMTVGNDQGGGLKLQAQIAGDQKGWGAVSVPGKPLSGAALHGVSRDGSTAYFTAHRDGEANCLMAYDFATRAVTQMSCGNFDEVVMSTAERTPIALEYELDLPRTEYLLPEHPEAKRLRGIKAAFSGQRVHLIGTTRDGNKALLEVDADRNPGGFYLLDEKTKRLGLLAPKRRWVDPRLMQPMAAVSIKARDGLQVPAYITAREGLKTRKAPMVVLPHGGPHQVRDYWEWNPEVQLLASRGYAVLQVNYRGSSGLGHDFERAGYRNWGTKIQDDIADATRWAIAEGIADPARICIYGTSFGGYSALMGVAREPDLYRCAAGLAGAYDLAAAADDSDIAESRLGRLYLQHALGKDKAVLQEHSPVTHVGKIKAALLIAHGTQDKRVPFSQAKLLRNALDQAKKPYEWLVYEGEEHGFFKRENEVDFYTRLLAFLDKHIGPGAGKG